MVKIILIIILIFNSTSCLKSDGQRKKFDLIYSKGYKDSEFLIINKNSDVYWCNYGMPDGEEGRTYLTYWKIASQQKDGTIKKIKLWPNNDFKIVDKTSDDFDCQTDREKIKQYFKDSKIVFDYEFRHQNISRAFISDTIKKYNIDSSPEIIKNLKMDNIDNDKEKEIIFISKEYNKDEKYNEAFLNVYKIKNNKYQLFYRFNLEKRFSDIENGNIYLQDLNGDGIKEIFIQLMWNMSKFDKPNEFAVLVFKKINN